MGLKAILMDADVCLQVRVDGEQKVAELQAQVEEQGAKLAGFTQESEKGETALQHYR